MAEQHVLVTGANGFVGRPLCRALVQRGFHVRAALRDPKQLEPGCEAVAMGDLTGPVDLSSAMKGVQAVIHTAARVHQMRESAEDAARLHDAVNHLATARLAEQAFRAGVRRFVYVSSIKVSGEATHGTPLTPELAPQPRDPYGRSKLAGEQAVARLAEQYGAEYVIVRPPLVYGPEVRANFRALMGVVARGLPLPLGAVHNRRSLIYVGNLVDCLVLVATHPAAKNRVFLPSDGDAMSSADLVRSLARGLDRAPRLLPVPASALTLLGRVTGKGEAVRRLVGSLEVDDPYLREQMAWRPPFELDQAMRETCAWFSSRNTSQA